MRELFTFSQGGRGEKPKAGVSAGIALSGALGLQDVTACFFFMLPGLHIKLMEGAGMKGCSVLEIK